MHVYTLLYYVYCNVFFLSFLFSIISFLLLPLFPRYLIPSIGMYLLLRFFYFYTPESADARKIWVCNWSMWEYMANYHSLQLIPPQEYQFDSEQLYIIGVHPHGIFNQMSHLMVVNTIPRIKRVLGKLRLKLLTAKLLFIPPIIREVVIACGYVDASRKIAVKMLERGNSLIVIPGGNLEVLESDRNRNEVTLILSKRKGFISLAIQHGCTLVPTYVFGLTNEFNQLRFGKTIEKWFIKQFKGVLTIFWGRWCTHVPYKVPLIAVMGTPIETVKKANPSEEEISRLHARYVQAIEDIHDKYKDRFGEGEKLIIK